IVFVSIVVLGGFLAHFSSGTRSVLPEKDSPAFSLALNTAIKTLEGLTSATATGARVAEAKGGAFQGGRSPADTYIGLTCEYTCEQTCMVTTCTEYTCGGYPTCVGFYTCECTYLGEFTCCCYPTCVGCTCKSDATCTRTPTCDNSPTCRATPTCLAPTCSDWYTCFSKLTCDGTTTCDGAYGCNAGTYDGSYTCDGSYFCRSWSFNGWPSCDQVGSPQCAYTPAGRTTWGSIKAKFK
ncbi:MAG: hypothetical protein QME66_12230, partial [Candidatus Eisenbacteria bacterium]|nr:hypothetical protein [Candidatus Eisenbacteria bacterium]